jgi:hypothetical protein
MRRALLLVLLLAGLVALAGASARGTKAASSITPTVVPLTYVGTTSLGAGSGPGSTDPVTDTTEIDQATQGDADSGNGGDDESGTNRTLPGVVTGRGTPVNPSKKAKSNPELGTNWEGLNFHDQRFANGGNQFSVEPPDQALCAGHGFILEAVNDVLRAYNTSGTPVTGVVDLNTFYGYPPAIVRSGPNAGQRGPSLTDPVCLFDQTTQRFFVVVLTLDHVGLTASLNGNNHLDIAVSDTSNPTGSWTIYRIPVQNNGTQGTPDHHCTNGFCLGDYPHIGADANAIYLTTNEFALFGSGFFGSQVYAIGKSLFTGGGGCNCVVLFNTLGAGPDGAGFTVWPATVPGSTYATGNGGTEYFLSSRAVFSDDGTSSDILEWTLTNSSSLNTATPAPSLSVRDIPVNEYAVPPRATQKLGNFPLGDCIADTTVHPTCNTSVAGIGSHNNITFDAISGGTPHVLNSNDSRFGQVVYANGKLWGALGTALTVNAKERAGVAYYVINPASGKLVLQGQAGEDGTDLTYPTVGVTDSGRGVISFTLTGDNNFPSAGYAPLDAQVGMGAIHTAAAGAGSWDGFTSYVIFGAGRPRWGDYGATAVMNGSIWAAAEYVAQTCTYATYFADPTCGGTRGALGNWSTHISKLTP